MSVSGKAMFKKCTFCNHVQCYVSAKYFFFKSFVNFSSLAAVLMCESAT